MSIESTLLGNLVGKVDAIAKSSESTRKALERIAATLEKIAERLDTNSSNGTFDVTTREAQ